MFSGARFLFAFLAFCTASLCAWAEEIPGTVLFWIDGDTCELLANSGEKIRVRLWLVDAPEKSQPMGQDATRYVKYHPDVGEKKRVVLDKITTDRYKRTIGQLRGEKEKEYCTADLLSSGYFWFYVPAMKNRPREAEVLKSIFDTTKAAKKGIFKYESSVPPWEWRRMSKVEREAKKREFEEEKRKRDSQ